MEKRNVKEHRERLLTDCKIWLNLMLLIVLADVVVYIGKNMRKAIAIFFLFVFTTSFTEAGQLVKLPLLLEHFTKHRCQDSTLSFTSFIEQHYLDDHRGDGDDQQDNQLPFKSCPLNTSAPVFVLTAELLFPQALTCSAKVYGLPQTRFVLSNHLFGIFHPPRDV